MRANNGGRDRGALQFVVAPRWCSDPDLRARGAVVVTLGPRRELLGRIITSSSGTFRIGQDSAVIVRVMRIGYSPQERRLEGTAAPIVIELTPLGRGLRAVTVSSNPLWSADWRSSSDAGW